MTVRALELLEAVREAGVQARAAGELVDFLTELERVRLELVVTPPTSPTVCEADRLLTAEETARKIRMSVWWVRANKNALPIVRLPGGRYRFSYRGLERWLLRRAAS